jgi:hypothetical protein
MDWADAEEYRESDDRCDDGAILDVDWEAESDVDGDGQDGGLAREKAWHESDPFMRDELAWTCQDFGATRRACERLLQEFRPRRLSAADLRSMLAWDEACFYGDLYHECADHGCGDPRVGGGRHGSGCRWRDACGEELELHGLALFKTDRGFWNRLRMFGATPKMVAQANTILNPLRCVAPQPLRRWSMLNAAPRRTRARSRGRRSTPARRAQIASRGSPDDPGDPEPAGRHDVRHPATPRERLP